MPSCAWCSMCSGLPQLKVPSFSLPWVSFQGRGTMPSRSHFTLVSRFALRVGLVTIRQTFVHCSQNCVTWSVTPRGRRPARLGRLGLASSAVSESGGDAPLRPKADDPPRGGRGAPCAPARVFPSRVLIRRMVLRNDLLPPTAWRSHDFSCRLPICVAEDHPKHAPHGLVALSMLLKHFH